MNKYMDDEITEPDFQVGDMVQATNAYKPHCNLIGAIGRIFFKTKRTSYSSGHYAVDFGDKGMDSMPSEFLRPYKGK